MIYISFSFAFKNLIQTHTCWHSFKKKLPSSIMNNDISSQMCTLVSKAISIILVILMGSPLSSYSSGLDHSRSVCKIMVVTYDMCFIILNTLMEPLRASIKAVYVSFAQHPQSLSQAFPLLYHRLNRISEEWWESLKYI